MSAGILVAQERTARPARGNAGLATQVASGLDNVNLQNGNVSLQLPLATLPPIAGGKLSGSITAYYNSKLYNAQSREVLGSTSVPGCAQSYSTSEVTTGDTAGGWRVGGGYVLFFRNAREDYDYLLPNSEACSGSEFYWMTGNFFKPMLRSPDGGEHELRIFGNYETYNVQGSKDFLRNYYRIYGAAPAGPLELYSIDGTYLKITYNSWSNWTLYLKDGTQVRQTSDGQRVRDTSGNSVFYGPGFVRDEQTGREIRFLEVTENGQHLTRVQYQKVGGAWAEVKVIWGTTQVQGKTYTATAWRHNGGSELNTCTIRKVLQQELAVVREIILPATESGVAPAKYTFGYNSDTTTSATLAQMPETCEFTTSYTRTVSQGLGEINQIATPSGAVYRYYYHYDGQHDFGQVGDDGAAELSRNVITRKEVSHDGRTDTWLYGIDTGSMAAAGSVVNPDGSYYNEQFYPVRPGYEIFGSTGAKAGLTYRTVQSGRVMTEKHWLQRGGVIPAFGTVDKQAPFNTVVTAEFTTLLNNAGQRVKMSARSFLYDYNGDLLQTTEYDWFDPASVTFDTSTNLPVAIPATAPVLRTVNNSYYHQADNEQTPTAYHRRAVSHNAPTILGVLHSTTLAGTNTASRFSYDNQSWGTAPTLGRLTKTEVWDDSLQQWHSTQVGYDQYGNVATQTDARGHTTQLFYEDATHAQPTRTVIDPLNGTGAQTSTAVYDFATGLPLSTTDANGAVSTLDYTNHLLGETDPWGRPGTVWQPAVLVNGNAARQSVKTYYEDAARRTRVVSDLAAEGDGLIRTRATRDQLERPILQESNEDGTESYTLSAQTLYDTAARVVWQGSVRRADTPAAEASWTRTTSDLLGRPIETATFSGAACPPVSGTNSQWTGSVTTAYDVNYTTVTDQAGRQRRSVTDAAGRLLRVDEPDKSSGVLGPVTAPVQPTAYGYDVLGNLTTVRQGGEGATLATYTGGQTRTFAYNSLSRLMSATNPESGTLSYTYDANGNLLTKTDARSVTASYQYDALNRNTQVSYNDGTPSVTRRYDGTMPFGKGKLWQTETANTALVTVDSFDALGRPGRLQQQFWVANAWSATYEVKRKYNLATLQQQTYPSGHTTTYGYDALGRLASFAGNLGDGVTRTYAHEMVYDAAGRLTREKYETLTRLYHKQQYNGRGQLWDMQLGTDSSFGPTTPDVTNAAWNRGRIINHYASNFQLGASGTTNNGNLLRQEIYLPNAHFTQQNYDYDQLNRLTSAAETLNGTGAELWRQQYDYDLYGNRTINQTATMGYGVPKPHFTVDTATNRLLVPNGLAGTMNYDAAGNLSYDNYTGGGTRTFDAENRMREAWSGVPTNGSLQGQYTYDGDGRRISRTAGNATTWQVYGLEGELVAEYAAQAHALLAQKEYGYQGGKMLISAVNGDETRLRRFVENFYQRTWLTLPDNATIQAQVNALAAQGLISHAAMLQHAQQFGASLFTSTTYLNRNTTNGMYVADLYLAYLQRPPDEGGFEYWKEVLDANQISRATLRDAFAGYGYSPSEYGGILDALRASGVNDYDRVDRFVNYVYTATSGNGQTGPTVAQRDYERARFDVAEAQNRDAVRALAEQLGTERLSANNWHSPEWSDMEYVRRLYETFLRHAPDTAGWGYWAAAVEEQGRGSVLGAFLEAGAYREQADALYREIYWLVGDHLGTPRLIVSRTGSLASVKRHDYLPFGEELPVGAGGRATSQGYTFTGDSVRQQFTGYERDDETGLDYAQARYFSSGQGRFISPDPFDGSGIEDLPQSWNRYTYVLNNPLMLIDPTGLIWIYGYNAQEKRHEYVYFEGDTYDQEKYAGYQVIADGSVVEVGSVGGDTGNRGYWKLGADGVITRPADEELGQTIGVQLGSEELYLDDFAAEMNRRGPAIQQATFLLIDVYLTAADAVTLGGSGVARQAGKQAVKQTLLKGFCFVAGTPVLTAEGLKPIEDIKAGDQVLSYNEQTQQTEYKPVVQTMVRQVAAGHVLSVTVAGEAAALGVTDEHPFYVRIHRARDNTSGEADAGEWRAAGKLQSGDEIRQADGSWAKVEEIRRQADGATVYNFTVADNHNYFVGQTSLLAHNSCWGKLTKGGRGKIGNMAADADKPAREVLKKRGGHASATHAGGQNDYWDMPLGEVANRAAAGDAAAETVMKEVKQAGKKAAKYSGKQ